MIAGRELDALIAEKVMGFDMTRPSGFKYPIGMPHYSTEIAAAWAIVEKLQSDYSWTIVDDKPPAVCARFGQGDHDYEVVARTAPLAICLAALKAVGAEETTT